MDGRVLTLLPTGLAQYTVNLLRKMTAISSHEWVVFAPGEILADLSGCHNTLTICGRMRHPGVILAWQQVGLPKAAARHHIDLLWSPHHYLPAMPRIPKVCTIHDLVWAAPELNDMAKSRVLAEAILMPLAAKRADRIIAVSEATKACLEARLPGSRGKTTVIHEGPVPLPAPNNLDLSTLGITEKYVLFVGTRQHRKNLGRLVEAFGLLPETVRSGVQLVIVGAELRRGNDELGPDLAANSKIVQTGYVPDETLSLLYERASVFAMPSLLEGFGLPLLEAMSKGVPILTSDRSSMPEVVGDAALLVDPTDPRSIASALEQLLVDDGLRERLTTLGLKRMQHFSWSNAASQTLEVLELAAGERPRK